MKERIFDQVRAAQTYYYHQKKTTKLLKKKQMIFVSLICLY